MTQKKGKFQPSTVLIASFLVLFVIVAYYVFFFIPAKKARLTERYLRLAAMMSTQFETLGENLAGVVKKTYRNQPVADESRSSSPIRYFKEKTEAALIPIFNSLKITEKGTAAKGENITWTSFLKDIHDDVQGSSFNFHVGIDPSPAPSSGTPPRPTQELILSIKTDDVMKNISPNEDFDDVLIIDQDGRVVFSRENGTRHGLESSLMVLDLGPLVNSSPAEKEKNPDGKKSGDASARPTDSAPVSSLVVDFSIGRVPYKLFLQPLALSFVSETRSPEKTWVIGGLLSARTFNQRSRVISSYFLLFLIFLVPLVLISYPLAKFLLMGPKERVRRRDVVFYLLALILGAPILTFILLTLGDYASDQKTTREDLKTLADEIHARFSNEIENAVSQLKNIAAIDLASAPLAELNEGRLLRKYPYYDMVFTVNDAGRQTAKIVINQNARTEHAKNPFSVYRLGNLNLNDVSQRKYFSNILKKEAWFSPDLRSSWMIEPVFSMSSGLYELNISIPLPALDQPDVRDDKTSVAAAMSFRPLSVSNPVLPEYYGFALIDRDGQVIFHSQPRFNAVENFYAECDRSDVVRAAVYARANSGLIRLNYQGKKRDLVLRPIDNIPWSIAVFRDREDCGYHFLERIVLAGAMYGKYAVLAIAALLVAALIYLYQQWKAKPEQRFLSQRLNLLWPQPELNPEYFRLFILNLSILAGMFFCLIFRENLPLTYLILPAVTWFPAAAVLIPALSKISSPPRSNDEKPSSPLTAVSLMILWTIAAVLILPKKIPTIGIILLPPVLYAGVYLSLRLPLPAKKGGRSSWPHLWLLLTFFLLLFTLPSMMYYKIAYQEEAMASAKMDQLDISRNFAGWKTWFKAHYQYGASANVAENGLKNLLLPLTLKSQSMTFPDDFFLYVMKLVSAPMSFDTSTIDMANWISEGTETQGSAGYIRPGEIVFRFINMFMTFSNDYLGRVGFFYRNASFPWTLKTNQGKHRLRLFLNETDTLKDDNPFPLATESSVSADPWRWLGFKPVSSTGAAIIVILTAMSFFLYILFKDLLKRIFLSDLALEAAETGGVIQKWTGVPSGKTIISGEPAGLPREGNPEEGLEVVDGRDTFAFIESDITAGKETRKILVTNFDTRMHNADFNSKKLTWLERRVFDPHLDITLISRFEPLQYFALETVPVRDSKNAPAAAAGSVASELTTRWNRVMSFFKTKLVIEERSRPYSSDESQPRPIRTFIEGEFYDPDFLAPIRGQILEDMERFRKSKTEKSGSPLKIKLAQCRSLLAERARPIYDGIWRSCTKDEKLVLIHLACEGLLNPKNGAVIRRLVERRLILTSPLRLMNTTFQDYVKTASDTPAILEWERLTGESHWTRVRRPLLLFLVGMTFFLIVTQPGLLESGITWAAAITGTLTIGVRFLEQMKGLWKKNGS